MERNYLSYEIDKLMEENRKLRLENRRFQELLACNQDVIYRYHITERFFEYVSPAAHSLTGFPPAEFYVDPGLLGSLVPPDYQAVFDEFWQSSLTGQQGAEIQFPLQPAEGEPIWTAMRSWPVLNRIGKPVAFVGTIRDISIQKAMEERIRKLEGLVPICAGCKKIRRSDGSWEEIEAYLNRRSNMDFTHSLCPSCRDIYFPPHL
jgi:PAS domain S-box-containing protein